jgi:hypothetical protein
LKSSLKYGKQKIAQRTGHSYVLVGKKWGIFGAFFSPNPLIINPTL